eukprot:1179476-Amphidinium_carterae.1
MARTRGTRDTLHVDCAVGFQAKLPTDNAWEFNMFPKLVLPVWAASVLLRIGTRLLIVGLSSTIGLTPKRLTLYGYRC